MNRPDCFGFAMDSLGDPEAEEMLAYIQALEKAQGEWINVDHRLPSPNTGVLVFNRYKFIACIDEDGSWFSAEDCETLFQVTHWQPLPSDPTTSS